MSFNLEKITYSKSRNETEEENSGFLNASSSGK